MQGDFFLVLRWWGMLFLVGAVAFPLTKRLFAGWYDKGYLFAKAVGMATVTFLVYLLGRLHLVPFTEWSIYLSMGLIFVFGMALQYIGSKRYKGASIKYKGITSVFSFIPNTLYVILIEELFFFAALLFWAWIKGHEPSIHGLEKFMDYGFTKSILNSAFFPAVDMWYPPHPINYYYFGHTVLAVLTKLSGIDLAYAFNFMLATLFSLTATMSFSIGAQLFHNSSYDKEKNRELGIGNREGKIFAIRNSVFTILSGMLTGFLVTLAGNMQTLYAFTQGYSGDDVKPFWELLWPLGELWQKLPAGMQSYWYANATRFIPYTIHEFPSYSFVVSDLHGHVLSLPFALLAIALLVHIFSTRDVRITDYGLRVPFYGFLCGVLLMTNALDGPIYFGLFLVLFIIHNSQFIIQWKKHWKQICLMIGIPTISVVLASLPFLTHFQSFVTGIGVNCPPAALANTKIALFLFEGVEKCQHSPLWMMWLLWGFFWFTGGWFILSKVKVHSEKLKVGKLSIKLSIRLLSNTKLSQLDILLSVFFLYSMLLIIFPEFFYFKDIYPQHFRSNTMFKLGYEAFIMFSIVAGASIITQLKNLGLRMTGYGLRITTAVFFLFLAPQLFLVSIYPLFSVRSYFNSLKTYEGLDGLAWILRQYPNDYAAINWLNSADNELRITNYGKDSFTILEADGDSYTDYARFSAFTGLPTVIGWPVHEWLWRGSYDVVAPRREDVRMLYESEDIQHSKQLITQYGIRYVVVGALERQKFTTLQEWKFATLGTPVFTQGDTTIYIMKEGAEQE